MEVRPRPILDRHVDPVDHRPCDGEPRIVTAYSPFRGGRIELGDQIEDFAVVGQRLIAVRKPLRDVELAAIDGAQLDSEPLTKGDGIGTEVDDDIPNGPANAANDLGFLQW